MTPPHPCTHQCTKRPEEANQAQRPIAGPHQSRIELTGGEKQQRYHEQADEQRVVERGKKDDGQPQGSRNTQGEVGSLAHRDRVGVFARRNNDILQSNDAAFQAGDLCRNCTQLVLGRCRLSHFLCEVDELLRCRLDVLLARECGEVGHVHVVVLGGRRARYAAPLEHGLDRVLEDAIRLFGRLVTGRQVIDGLIDGRTCRRLGEIVRPLITLAARYGRFVSSFVFARSI